MRIRCFAAILSLGTLAAAPSDVADAAQQRNRDLVRSLIQQKADVKAAQADGTTALHWVARWDDVELAGLLTRRRRRCQSRQP